MKGLFVAVGIVAFLVGLSVAPLPTLFLLLAGLITWVSFKLDLIQPTMPRASERLSHRGRKTVRRWLRLWPLLDGSVHVIPDDGRIHIMDREGTCVCGPRVDGPDLAPFVEHHRLTGHGAIRR